MYIICRYIGACNNVYIHYILIKFIQLCIKNCYITYTYIHTYIYFNNILYH